MRHRKRIETMTEIIKSCGIEHDPHPDIEKMKEQYLQEKHESKLDPNFMEMIECVTCSDDRIKKVVMNY